MNWPFFLYKQKESLTLLFEHLNKKKRTQKLFFKCSTSWKSCWRTTGNRKRWYPYTYVQPPLMDVSKHRRRRNLRMATDLESSRWSALDWSRSSLWRNWIVRWCKTLASSWQWVKISEANETNEASCLRHADSVWLLMNWRISSSSLSSSNFVFNRLKRTGVTCRNTNGIVKFKLFNFYLF